MAEHASNRAAALQVGEQLGIDRVLPAGLEHLYGWTVIDTGPQWDDRVTLWEPMDSALQTQWDSATTPSAIQTKLCTLENEGHNNARLPTDYEFITLTNLLNNEAQTPQTACAPAYVGAKRANIIESAEYYLVGNPLDGHSGTVEIKFYQGFPVKVRAMVEIHGLKTALQQQTPDTPSGPQLIAIIN